MDQKKIFKKLENIARAAGRQLIEKALTLWFCLQDKDTPLKIRGLILGDLIYLVSPFDAVPDAIPGIGFSDDMGVLTLSLIMLAAHIKPEHLERAKAKVGEWLG